MVRERMILRRKINRLLRWYQSTTMKLMKPRSWSPVEVGFHFSSASQKGVFQTFKESWPPNLSAPMGHKPKFRLLATKPGCSIGAWTSIIRCTARTSVKSCKASFRPLGIPGQLSLLLTRRPGHHPIFYIPSERVCHRQTFGFLVKAPETWLNNAGFKNKCERPSSDLIAGLVQRDADGQNTKPAADLS